ncbi:MAG: AglZ/HisF2 family acetamidino modification protein [Microthrixaceae bacterium]
MKFRPRVIPVLLLKDGGLVKTTGFGEPRYLGDPVNIVRIFNDKGVDELVLLDIDATSLGRSTDQGLLEEIASEAFVPVSSGGGIGSLADIERRLALGFEKAVIDTAAVERPDLISAAAAAFGSSTISVCIDVRRKRFGRRDVVVRGGATRTGLDPVEHARKVADLGAGEIVVQSVDLDGSMGGYDLELIGDISAAVDVPVVAVGGAGSVDDLGAAVSKGAAAVGAGSMFVYQGRHRAVLINYPDDHRLESVFTS